MMMSGGSEGGDGGVVMKKGPWTAAEDETLAAYVRDHGEGNWNAVQKKTWLARCGKSCRLRWANHLRPNLRKGSFTVDEERLIIQLHSQLGNKWSRMAAQLPGRTDNEIKNYWNTRLKRFQRQGLPLYPQDILPSNHQQQHINTPSSSSTPASSFTFQASLSQGNYPSHTPSLRHKRCFDNAFSTNPSSSQTFLHTGFSPYAHLSTNPVYSIKHELPSNQNAYPKSLGVYEVSNFVENGNGNEELNTGLSISTCQLLENLMEEVEALEDSFPATKRRHLMAALEEDNNFFSGSFRHCGSSDNICSLQGLESKEEESLQINAMQVEDIVKLLDWGSESEDISNGEFSVITAEDNLVLNDHEFALLFPLDDDDNTNKNSSLSSCSWDNLQGIL
ncbi:unnamed protein product [Cochlearia groenlandica]